MEKDDFECDYEAEHYSCCILLLVNYQLLSVAESMSKANSSSFDAFSKVDELVSKPVYGSETIASWQSFRKDHGPKHPSSAPKAPLKKADKLSTGFNTWEEERAHEGEIRREAGHAATNSGYQLFNDEHKKKAAEAAERKRKARIEARIRPDDKEYLIPSKTFEGWKFDYVFTTKNGTTGYYWDGMDSIKKENGELAVAEKMEPSQAPSTSEAKDSEKSAAKKPKKKRKRAKGPTFVHDPNNPMEQMQAILQQRNQKIRGIPSENSLPVGWEAATDPSTGKTYYFHRASGHRSWEKPTGSENTNSNQESSEILPEGWKSAVDPASGKTYYHHTSGKTSWEKPK